MPVNYVKKLSKQYDMPVEEVEKIWNRAKEIVDKNYPNIDKDSDSYWKLVSAITLEIVKAKSAKQSKSKENRIEFVFKD